MHFRNSKSCGRITEYSLTQCFDWLGKQNARLIQQLKEFGVFNRPPRKGFHVRYSYGTTFFQSNPKFSVANTCQHNSDPCDSCRLFLEEWQDRELLVVLGSKIAEIFVKYPNSPREAPDGIATIPALVLQAGDAFFVKSLLNAIQHSLGVHNGFSVGVSAGTRTIAISTPVKDVRLSKKIRANLPKSLVHKYAQYSDRQMASFFTNDPGSLLQLILTTDPSQVDAWQCDLLILSVDPQPNAAVSRQQGIIFSGDESTVGLPAHNHLRCGAIAHALAGLCPYPYADRTVLHLLGMVCGEVPGFRPATVSAEALPIQALIHILGNQYWDEFDGIPVILESFQLRQLEHLQDTANIYYSPAMPTVIGPVEQPRSYKQFFDELELRLIRLKKAGLLSAQWSFYSSQAFKSPLGTAVLQPTVDKLSDPTLDQFLDYVNNTLSDVPGARAMDNEVIGRAKSGFFSRFIRVSRSPSIKNLPRAGRRHP